MKTFIEYLNETKDFQKDVYTYKLFKSFIQTFDTKQLSVLITTRLLELIAEMFDVDAEKFKNENEKLVSKLEKIVSMTSRTFKNSIPVLAVHYPTTKTNMLLAFDAKIPSLSGGVLNFAKDLAKAALSVGVIGALTGSSPKAALIPFKFNSDDKKIELDISKSAITQICLTMLLSDVDFDTLWPVNANTQPIMKYLDFICPSVLDLLAPLTAGGSSVAARAVKLTAKYGAKTGAKAATKTATKNTLKLAAKLAKKAPKKVQKAVKRGRKMYKKAAKNATLTRNTKNAIKSKTASEEASK